MTLNDAKRKELIAYRIEQAQDAIKDVEISLENDRLQPAINRIYDIGHPFGPKR